MNRISPTACRVMAKRLRDVCALPESEPLWRAGRGFVVRDLPWTEEKLRVIPPFEFENWAVITLGGIPNKVQVGDMGVDGRIFPVFDNSPAIHGWVHGSEMSQVPSGTKENHLPSLTGLGNSDGIVPSTKVLGYFQRSLPRHGQTPARRLHLPESEPLWQAGCPTIPSWQPT